MMTAASPTMQTLAPVLIVDAVEPCLEFWATNLGFTNANEVPGPDGKLVFASVKKDGVEIMYQTRASVVADSPAQAAELTGHSVALFLTVAVTAGVDVRIPDTFGCAWRDALAAVATATAAIRFRFGAAGLLGAVTPARVAAAASSGRLLAPGWPGLPDRGDATPVAPVPPPRAA